MLQEAPTAVTLKSVMASVNLAVSVLRGWCSAKGGGIRWGCELFIVALCSVAQPEPREP